MTAHRPFPMRQRIDIVLPCYNPPPGWQQAISAFYGYIAPFFDVHFFIVDDGTTSEKIDETVRSISDRLPLRVVTLSKNRGKGFALRAGVTQAAAPFVLYTDIDLPFTKESMRDMMETVTGGACDVVAGTRDAGYYDGTMSAFRRRLSRAFRFFMKRIIRIGIDDTQCGLKAFNRKGRELFLATRTDRYLFDFEFIYRAVRTPGLRVRPMKVQLRENVVFNRMRWPVLLREGFNLLSILARR